MPDDKKEPTRPTPSSGRTTGATWANLTPDEFEKAEQNYVLIYARVLTEISAYET